MMNTNTLQTGIKPASETSGTGQMRQQIRIVAAIASAATTLMYLLIAFHVVAVVQPYADQTWAFAPAAAYALGTALLVVFDRRLLWVLGAVLQVLVIAMYFNVAPQRTPAFEVWGILIRVAQFILLGTLAYLVMRKPFSQTAITPLVR
jgi:hypothetical protein